MQSKRGWVSLSKRWRVIQQEYNKFYATYESIKARPTSAFKTWYACPLIPFSCHAFFPWIACPFAHICLLGFNCRYFKLWRHSRFNTTTKPSISPIVGLSSTGRSSRRNMPPSWRVGGKKLCRTMVTARRPGREGRPTRRRTCGTRRRSPCLKRWRA